MCQLNKHLTFSCSATAAPRKLKAETDAQLATCCDTCQNQSQRSKFFLSLWTEQTRNRVCLIWFPSMSSVRQAAPATDDSNSNSCSLPHKMAATVTLPARPGYIWLHLRPQGKTATVPSEHVVKCKAYWLNYTQRGQINWQEKSWELFKLKHWKHMEEKHAKHIESVLWNKICHQSLLKWNEMFEMFLFSQLLYWLHMCYTCFNVLKSFKSEESI